MDGFGRSKLDFGFQVTDVPSAQYQCKVYIDQNQDGKFEEGLADVDGSGDADDSDDTGKFIMREMFLRQETGNRTLHR